MCLCLSIPVPAVKEDGRLVTQAAVICLFDLIQEDSPQLCALFFGDQFKGLIFLQVKDKVTGPKKKSPSVGRAFYYCCSDIFQLTTH